MKRIIAFTSVFFATLGLVATGISAAQAASPWSTPVSLSSASLMSMGPEVVVDSSGRAIAVWTASFGSSTFIQSSTSLNGSSWSTPVTISSPSTQSGAAHVVVDSTGRAVAVWRRNNGSNNILQSSTSVNGGSWTTPVDVSAAGIETNNIQLAVDSSGRAIVVWDSADGSNRSRVRVSSSVSGGAWSAPVMLSYDIEAYNPHVVIDSSNRATVLWDGYNSNSDNVMMSSTSVSGAAWSAPLVLSAVGSQVGGGFLGLSSSGRAIAMWMQWDGTSYTVRSSNSVTGGAWSTPVTLSTAGYNAYNPRVAVDGSGRAIAVWHHYNGTTDEIQSSSSVNGGAWSTPVNLSREARDFYYPEVIVDSAGRAIVTWSDDDGGSDDVVQSSTSVNGGAWSAPVTVSVVGLTSYEAKLAPYTSGRALAVWACYDGTSFIVQSSLISAQAPAIPSAPRSLTAGVVTSSSVALSWLVPSSLNGATITDYVVKYRKAGTTPWLTFSHSASPVKARTVTGLQRRTSYEFKVAAVASAGTSAYTAVLTKSTFAK